MFYSAAQQRVVYPKSGPQRVNDRSRQADDLLFAAPMIQGLAQDIVSQEVFTPNNAGLTFDVVNAVAPNTDPITYRGIKVARATGTSTHYWEVPDSIAARAFGVQPIGVSFFTNNATSGNFALEHAMGQAGSGAGGVRVGITALNNVRFTTDDVFTYDITINDSIAVVGEINHCAVYLDSDNDAHLYWNGVFQNTVTHTSPMNAVTTADSIMVTGTDVGVRAWDCRTYGSSTRAQFEDQIFRQLSNPWDILWRPKVIVPVSSVAAARGVSSLVSAGGLAGRGGLAGIGGGLAG